LTKLSRNLKNSRVFKTKVANNLPVQMQTRDFKENSRKAEKVSFSARDYRTRHPFRSSGPIFLVPWWSGKWALRTQAATRNNNH
jgi:hypothetical protein